MLHKMTSNLRSSCFSLPNIWEGPVLFRVSIPFITHHDQMGGKGLFQLIVLQNTLSLKKVKVGTQTGLGLDGKKSWWACTAYWLAHSVFPQSAILHYLGPPAQGWHRSQWAGPSHTNNQSRKCPADLPTEQSFGGILSIKMSASHRSIACIELTKTGVNMPNLNYSWHTFLIAPYRMKH